LIVQGSVEISEIRVIFAGGGTGGHVYPALAMHDSLVEALGPDGVNALFVGVAGGLEKRLLPGSRRDVTLQLLPGRGFRGASLANKLQVPFDVARGATRGVRTIRDFRPDVVVGTGGYASVSMVVASILTATPRILQEQNSVPGLVNRRLARFADLVLLSYEESTQRIAGGVETVVIGNPLRRTPAADRTAGAMFFGLDPERPTVLVIGGSRGAHSLNAAAIAATQSLLDETDSQFVVLTGERDFAEVTSELDRGDQRLVVRPYVDEIHHAYSIADVALARAGASSVFELATFGVPTIFVPYPYAADDHQRLNVEPLCKLGAAMVIDDAELDGDRLSIEIRALLEDDSRRAKMSSAMKGWVREDAADEAAGRIIGLVKKNAVRHAEKCVAVQQLAAGGKGTRRTETGICRERIV
jgi:UDP-N-acetylglucosamine--N-acetylmuramyl-(pentapeptide) pyrophosphoryl-undecaprenol N-acetylglucosamine transferase